jgi:hypothetical protein
MSLVIKIARMIDPGAYAEAWDGLGLDSKRIEPTARIKLAQATAECKAVEILTHIRGLSTEVIREALASHELDGWKKLGLPDNQHLRDAVSKKHGVEFDAA